MMNKAKWLSRGLAVFSMYVAASAPAADWIFRVGAHNVNPKSDNHAVVNVDDGTSLTFNLTYMVNDNVGVELLAAAPFKHDINLNGGGRVAETKHLPPTLSLQYHFMPQARFRPYVGAGLNYTLFFSEDTTGALAGTRLELDPSFGIAAQLGADIQLNDSWFLNFDVRWFDIDADAKLDGADLGTVAIDPFAVGISVGRKFTW
jgi:outer membrane protein